MQQVVAHVEVRAKATVTLAVAAVPVPAITKIHFVVCNEKYALRLRVRIFVYNHLDLSTP